MCHINEMSVIPMSAVLELDSEAAFHAFVATNPTAVVEFWAVWCDPCRQLSPVVEAIAASDPGFTVAKIDYDQVQPLANSLGVLGLPATLVFKQGEKVAHITGAKPRAPFEAAIRAVL